MDEVASLKCQEWGSLCLSVQTSGILFVMYVLSDYRLKRILRSIDHRIADDKQVFKVC